MKDMERMGAREWRDETISSPRRVGKTLRRKIQSAMSDGDAGPYADAVEDWYSDNPNLVNSDLAKAMKRDKS